MARLTPILAIVAGALALPASTAALTDFTWSGASPVASGGSPNWSNGANWTGGSAPSGAVGTLVFPALTNAECTASSPSEFCYQSTNDVSGQSANAISVDDGVPYNISGNPITLGAGGLTAAPSANDTGPGGGISLPIVLAAPQTWSITGGTQNQQVRIGASVSGTGDPLDIRLSNSTFLAFEGSNVGGAPVDVEVGPVTVEGEGTITLGGPDTSLNATDRNAVNLGPGSGLVNFGLNSQIGPLTAQGAHFQIGPAVTGTGTLAGGTLVVNGDVALDSNASLSMYLSQPGTTPGTDYSQISAHGSVNLANSRLFLNATATNGRCPALKIGDVDTLITTTGSLSGTFARLPDGSSVQVSCGTKTPQSLRINYTANAVTATVIPSGPVFGKTAGASVVSGIVLIRPPGSHSFVPLTGSQEIPIGSSVDTTNGVVRIAAASRSRHVSTGNFYRGEFQILQPPPSLPQTPSSLADSLVELRLGGGSFRTCPGASSGGRAAHAASGPHHSVRHLWGNAHGRFRMRGRYAASEVIGTRWLMDDRCDGTRVHVVAGKVAVRDFVKRRTVVVTAGHRYLVRAPH